MVELVQGETSNEWYKTFFHGVTLDFWRNAMTSDLTETEIDFVVKALKVKPGTHLLDVPCGNGRHAIVLAKRGYKVTGIDLSSEYIEEARSNSEGCTADSLILLHDDMRNIPEGNFDGAYCLGNSFGYFDPEACEKFIQSASRALKPGARFLIDTSTAAEVLIPNLQETRSFCVGDITMTVHNTYHPESSCLETTYLFEYNEEQEERKSLHWVFTTGEINRMLGKNFFRLVSLHGSTDGEPFRLGAQRLLLVAERA